MENFENPIEKEKGANVELIMHILRHGDRSPDGTLLEYGRTRTEKTAEKNLQKYEAETKIKAFGSPAGPKSEESGMQRSLETAHIYGKKIATVKEGKNYKSRARSLLNYEDWDVLLLDPKYDYDAIYNKAIDEYIKKIGKKYFEELTESEQKETSFYASNEATKYYMELDTEDAKLSRKEVAGTFAVLVERYIKMMTEKLNSNQKFLFPIGSHTGMIEPFLAQVVVWKDENGKEIHGATLEQLGGIFKPSEGFDIILKTDQSGKPEKVKISFDDNTRLSKEVYLDMQKIKDLAKFYRELHRGK